MGQVSKHQGGAILLPKWLMRTQSMQFNSVDVVLIMALTLRIHGTADAVRQTARNLRFKVCMEHQPKMKALAKLADDRATLQSALNIVQRATDALGVLPGVPFEVLPRALLIDPPRCHYKVMRLAGEAGARHWACQHCSHTKSLNESLASEPLEVAA